MVARDVAYEADTTPIVAIVSSVSIYCNRPVYRQGKICMSNREGYSIAVSKAHNTANVPKITTTAKASSTAGAYQQDLLRRPREVRLALSARPFRAFGH